MFSFSISILSVKCDGSNVSNWGQTSHIDTIKIFRSEKSFVQKNKLQRRTEVIRSSAFEQKWDIWAEVR